MTYPWHFCFCSGRSCWFTNFAAVNHVNITCVCGLDVDSVESRTGSSRTETSEHPSSTQRPVGDVCHSRAAFPSSSLGFFVQFPASTHHSPVARQPCSWSHMALLCPVCVSIMFSVPSSRLPRQRLADFWPAGGQLPLEPIVHPQCNPWAVGAWLTHTSKPPHGSMD